MVSRPDMILVVFEVRRTIHPALGLFLQRKVNWVYGIQVEGQEIQHAVVVRE